MSEVFWRDAASGSLIDPAMIPGTDIDGAALSSAAAGFRTRGGLLVERAEVVLGDWSGLAPVYSAPEAPTLLAAMDPIRTDVGVTAEKLARAADRIDDLAGVVAAPVRRLRELKVEAEAFVASVRGGVTVSGTDPDNPYYQAMLMTEGGAMGMAMAPEGHNSATINWSEHTPSVNRNNELIEQVNDEFVRIHNAVAECVNGITALIDGYCAPGMSTISDAQLAAMTETDYGSIGKGDRSCSESVGDGMLQAGTDMFAGIVSLGGGSFDDEWNWSHSWETAGAAWLGMLQGLGAIAMIGVPSIALTVTPDEALPSGLRAVKDWHAQQMTGLVEGIVGDPEMWAEDPVAAGAFAVTNIGSFFIPVAGGAAAAGKVGSVAARAGMSTVRLGTRLDGAVSSSVVVNVGELMARGGNTLTDLGRGSSAASRAELAGVLEVFEQTRVARNELSPPVGFGERMNAWGEQAAQLPARATEAMQHLGDRLGLHGSGGLLPAFADGVPGGGHRFDVEMPDRSQDTNPSTLPADQPAVTERATPSILEPAAVAAAYESRVQPVWDRTVVDAVDFRTETDAAYFWSGRLDDDSSVMDRALSYAERSGGVTLEELLREQGLYDRMPEFDPTDPASTATWERASEMYALHARGDVTAYVGSQLRPGNTWVTYELPALQANPNVTSVAVVNGQTGVRQVLWHRDSETGQRSSGGLE